MAKFNLLEYIKQLGGKLGRGQKPQPSRGQSAPRKQDIYNQLEMYIGAVPRLDPVTTGQTSKVGVNYQYPFGEYVEIVEKDPMIAALLAQRVSAVLNRDRVWKAANETTEALKSKALVEAVVARLDLHGDGGFQKDLFDLMQGLPMGIAIIEIVWDKVEFPIFDADGKELERREWFVPVRLLARDPRNFGWDKDDNIRLFTALNSSDGIEQHPLKYIVFRPYSRYEDPYGTPLLRGIWWPAWLKKQMLIWWAKRNERTGDPTVYAMPKDREHNWSDEQYTGVKDAIDNIQTQTGLTLPAGTAFGALEMTVDNQFEQFIRYVDDQYSMAITGQTGTSDTGEKGGSKGLGEVQERVAHGLQAMDARMLEGIVNSTLVAWTVMLNLGDVPLPRLQIVTEPPKDLLQIAEWFEKLVPLENVDIPARWVYETFGVDRAKETSEAVKPPAPPPTAAPGQQPSQQRPAKRRQKQNERRRSKPGENQPRPVPAKS